jgi:tetratricopeptide (TPR) repeat protein
MKNNWIFFKDHCLEPALQFKKIVIEPAGTWKVILLFAFSFCVSVSKSQDIYTRGLVYQAPEMKKVVVKQNIVYRSINDTALSFDIYYPPAFNYKKDLPLVVFNNGVGAMDIPRWGIYRDWAKLVAASGMIGLNYQSRGGNALQDGEALLDYLVQHAKELNIDAGKIGLWTCSANARTGMRLAYKTRPDLIKSLVVYYGGPDSLGQLRQDLPTLLVRAALDAQFINKRMEDFLQEALQQDVRVGLINYLNGIHAFDAYINKDESKEIIKQTISFFQKNLSDPVGQHEYVLTNKNFIWLMMNNCMQTALSEFRKARTMYRADTAFQPFFNAVIREDVLNANGYFLLQNRKQQEALETFKLAVETYPVSANAYESLSEAFEVTGNKEEGIHNAQLSLQKLPADSSIDNNFRSIVKRSAEERIKRLTNTNDIPASPHVRAHHELVYDEAKKKVMLTAGSTPLDSGNSFKLFNDIWLFEGTKWRLSGYASNERSGIRMAYDTKRDKLFSFGGYPERYAAEFRIFENGQWRILSNNAEMRAAEPGFVYDADRDKLIAFGGSVQRGVVNNVTWEWDGYSWKKFEGDGPGGRAAFAMVYDLKRKKTVLFGGSDGDGKKFSDDIWEFDGITWKQIVNKGKGPGSRISPGYAYDSKRGLLIIFGGLDNQGMKGDTWSWNGKEWKMLADKGPSARAMGYMAYDKARDKIVLFGGRLGWPNDAADTWEWDGKEWKQVK